MRTSSVESAAPPVAGDGETAFRELIDAHQGELHAHCYRMLGSLHDADDALQETLLRAWRGLPNFRGRSSLRTWLYRIGTNVCLDMIRKRPKRVLPVDYGPPQEPGVDEAGRPLPDGHWIEPYPDDTLGVADGAAGPEACYERREALELAFVAALQHLPARQRAALVLRDVLGFSAKEAAEALDTTVPSVNGALRRGRAAIDERLPEQSQQTTLRALGDRRLRELVDRFADSFEHGDIDAILAMLAEDATFTMPPYPEWCRGREAIAKSWLMPSGPPPRLRYAATRANGQLALGAYVIDDDDGSYRPLALDVLTLRRNVISEVTAFRSPAILHRFALPDPLERRNARSAQSARWSSPSTIRSGRSSSGRTRLASRWRPTRRTATSAGSKSHRRAAVRCSSSAHARPTRRNRRCPTRSRTHPSSSPATTSRWSMFTDPDGTRYALGQWV